MKKTIIIGIVVVAAAAFVWSKWETWFGNPDEPAYAPQAVPGRVMLTMGGGDEGCVPDETCRNISWQYGDEVVDDSYVELNGDTVPAKGEVFQSRGGKACYYHAKLKNLLPDSIYRYRVHNGDKVSEWYQFRTYTTDSFAFLYAGDIQDTVGGCTNALLRRAVESHPDVQFIALGGDLAERPIDYYWQEVYDGFDGLRQSFPIVDITGNHDYLKGVICRLERRYPLIFSYYLDSKVGDNMVYTFRYGDMQIFCLDSNREFFYLPAQRKWLKERLSESQARWKIVMLHHPLHSIGGAVNNLIQRWFFDDVIRENGVNLVLQGHEHAYARMEKDGTTYTISHCSPKNYKTSQDDRFDKVVKTGRFYQIVRIDSSGMVMEAYNADSGELVDKVARVADATGSK